MWYLLLEVALGWCALSVLLVLLWVAVREISRQAAARRRPPSEASQHLPRTGGSKLT